MATLSPQDDKSIVIQSFGGFRLWKDGILLPESVWKRDKALQLFQLLLLKKGAFVHKEELIDILWENVPRDTGERDFKVAMNALMHALEPDRLSHTASQFVLRNSGSYALNFALISFDALSFETEISAAHRQLRHDSLAAIPFLETSIERYKGVFLPERKFEDWTAAAREKWHTVALSAMTDLSRLLLEKYPSESLFYAEKVLGFEPTWEEAWRLMMKAYLALGNRPMALKSYERCADILEKAFDVEPLPITQALYVQIKQL
jgi:two-component SAPR family response regulator